MRLELALDHYLGVLKVERGLARNTVTSYGRDLSKLLRFAEDRTVVSVADLDLDLVTAWLAQLANQGLGTRSTARHLSSLRGWCQFLVSEGHLGTDPSRLVGRPRIGRRLPRPLELDAVWLLLEQPNRASRRGLRDLAMLSLAYAAGLRVSELLGLTLADLDRSRGVVSAYGKGGKRRLVPIGELCLNHVDAYLRAYPARQEANRRGLLFASPRGKPYSRQMFWKLVKRYAYRAGLAGDVHPHRLRHSFATHLLAGGADLRSVQTLLGHADVSTTEVYTYVSQPQIRAAHHASHPRG